MKKIGTLYGVGALIILVLGFVLGAVLWPYTINTWLEYFGREAVVTWWQGGFIGFIPYVGQMSLPAAFITWLLMLFI